MKFTQTVPGAVDLGDQAPLSFEFNTLEELVSNEYVMRFTRDRATKKFYRLSIEPNKYSYGRFDTTLMAEFNEGTWWWPVGYIDHGRNLNLPEWEPKS